MIIERRVHFGRARRNRKALREGKPKAVPPGRIPRISKLMALAIKMEDLLHKGEVASFAELAHLGHVHRSRVAQVMMLLNLAPEIQEGLLFLPRVEQGPDPIIEQDLWPVAAQMDWGRQRKMWRRLELADKNKPRSLLGPCPK